MVIAHNIMAMNSSRMLGIQDTKQKKSTEKLSSGYKINRGADDAAGLSISEKMRRQIRGLERGSTNAQDGVSSVQTAEGALGEVHDMLQRMDELATQAANGTNSQTDREAIQDEIDQLSSEIDRVSETTKFNETNLLKGGKGIKQVTMTPHDAGLDGKIVDNGDGTANFAMELKAGEQVNIGGTMYTLKEDDGVVATDAASIAAPISDLMNQDKVLVEYGTSMKGYQVADNISAIDINGGTSFFLHFSSMKTASPYDPTTPNLIDKNNRITLTYEDENGQDATYEMIYKGAPNGWEKIVSYNEMNGQPQTPGVPLYDSTSPNAAIADDELREVMRTAKKMVVTQGVTGETMTFGTAEDIRKDVEQAPVGSRISMTKEPGTGDLDNDIHMAVLDTADGGSGRANLTDARTVRETSDVIVGDDNTITIHDAKKLIAKELKQANSVGADDPAQVSIGSRVSGSDLAWSLPISAPTRVALATPAMNNNMRTTNYQVLNDLYTHAGTDLSNLITDAVSNGANPNAPTPNYTRATITAQDGTATTLVYEFQDAASPNAYRWSNLADGQVMDTIDVESLVSKAASIDLKWDTSIAETEASPFAAYPSTNPTYRWRTPDGMRADISKLGADDTVTVEGDAPYGVTYNSGSMAVKNDPSPIASEFDLTLAKNEVADELDFNLHTGPDADLAEKVSVKIDAMNTKFLGIQNLDVVGKDENGRNIDDGGKAATYALDAIEDAINRVNSQRSSLGAIQNRLEHTINNVDNVAENTTAAESRLRDTDIAEEMVGYSSGNVLIQAGQSMLAQANQSTQGALSLLGG